MTRWEIFDDEYRSILSPKKRSLSRFNLDYTLIQALIKPLSSMAKKRYYA